MTPKFIYFDLDDTILDHRAAEKRALADLTSIFPEDFSPIDTTIIQDVYHEKNVVLWRQYAEGHISKADLRERRFAHLLDSLNIESLAPLEVSERYLDRYAYHWDYCAGAREGFFEIAGRYPVGVLTNGFAEIQHAKLRRFPDLKDKLAACVISEEVGYMKPHPVLFEHASEAADTPPGDILYIGDSYHSDVEGGRNAGWDVIWYAPEAGEAPDDVTHASSWEEIVGRLCP